ncbi:unnamed protein product, partial [Plutella xylostella]
MFIVLFGSLPNICTSVRVFIVISAVIGVSYWYVWVYYPQWIFARKYV